MSLTYLPYDPDFVANIRRGGPDAYGNPAEHAVSDGGGLPCRYCLCDIPKGGDMLIMAARPFPDLQPYAETGPIFLCADCAPYGGGDKSEGAGDKSQELPPVLASRKDCLLKAYGADHRIIYGTGQITPTAQVAIYCETLLSDPNTAYVDARSASNNCFTLRIKRRNAEL